MPSRLVLATSRFIHTSPSSQHAVQQGELSRMEDDAEACESPVRVAGWMSNTIQPADAARSRDPVVYGIGVAIALNRTVLSYTKTLSEGVRGKESATRSERGATWYM